MGRRNDIDWEKIQLDYRAGIKTLREMAKEHSITHGAINKRARRDDWIRDFSLKIKEKAVIAEKPKAILAPADEHMRSGFIYVIYIDDSAKKRFFKIGMSGAFRGRTDAHQGSSPFDVCVACAYYVDNMRLEEKILHEHFSEQRIRGEWFQLDIDDIKFISRRAMLI